MSRQLNASDNPVLAGKVAGAQRFQLMELLQKSQAKTHNPQSQKRSYRRPLYSGTVTDMISAKPTDARVRTAEVCSENPSFNPL